MTYQGAAVPWVLGSIMQGNRATNCNHAIYLTTGVEGAVILDTQLVNTPDVLSNTPSGGSTTAATDIVVQ